MKPKLKNNYEMLPWVSCSEAIDFGLSFSSDGKSAIREGVRYFDDGKMFSETGWYRAYLAIP